MMRRRSSGLEFSRLSTWLPLVGCVAVTFPRLLLDSGDSLQRIAVPWAIALSIWWCVPLLGFVLGAQSAGLRWGGSVLYVVVAASILSSVYRSESSTAVFGIFFPPLYLALALGVVVGAEGVALWWRSHDR